MSMHIPSGPPLAQGVSEDPATAYVRLFTRFLQIVFGSFEEGAYRWLPDMQLTDIVIQAEGTINREVVEKRPAIIVGRGPVAFTNISINQDAGPLLDPKTGKLTRTRDNYSGASRHTDLLSGSVAYNCLSSQGTEATRLGWTCVYATRVLKKALMHAGLHRVGEEGLGVGAESQPGSIVTPDAGEIIMVSVPVPFFGQQTWTLEPEDKTLLTRVSLALRSELGPTVPSTAWTPRPPGMNGLPLTVTKVVPITQDLDSSES